MLKTLMICGSTEKAANETRALENAACMRLGHFQRGCCVFEPALIQAGAAIVSIGLSIFLWNYPLPDHQFWTLNIILDLAFVVTALSIPIVGTKEVSHAIRSQVERFGHAVGKHGLGSYHGRP